MIRVFCEGKKVDITDRDLLGQGGEGTVYAKGDLAYKIYHDPTKMIPLGKIQELSKIQNPKVIRPLQTLQDDQGRLIGYSMRRLSRHLTLCEMSTRAFRDQNGLTPDRVDLIVRDLQEILPQIHQTGTVLVDLNDLNVMVDPKNHSVAIIDLDSVQTPTFPATAIMETIRDPLGSPPFKPDQDWFAFAVLAFRAYTCSGPYRGYHPLGVPEMERKRLGLSGFDPGARLPGSAFPVDSIPDRIRPWLQGVLSHQFRGSPDQFRPTQRAKPDPQQNPIPHPTPLLGQFYLEPLLGEPNFLISMIEVGSHQIRVTTPKHQSWNLNYRGSETTVPIGTTLVGSPRDPHPMGISLSPTWEVLASPLDPSRKGPIPTGIQADHLARTLTGQGLLHIEDGIFQLGWHWNETKPVFYLNRVANCSSLATYLQEGGAITMALKRPILLYIPSADHCLEIPLPDLDGVRICSLTVCPGGALISTIRKKTGEQDLYLIRISGADHEIIPIPNGGPAHLVATPNVLVLQMEQEIRLYPNRIRVPGFQSFQPPTEVKGNLWSWGGRICGMTPRGPVYLKTKP